MSIDTENGRVVAVAQLTTLLTKRIREELDRSTRTCLNCLHFDEPNEVCRQYNNQRPPARIIALGCDGHEDEIPL